MSKNETPQKTGPQIPESVQTRWAEVATEFQTQRMSLAADLVAAFVCPPEQAMNVAAGILIGQIENPLDPQDPQPEEPQIVTATEAEAEETAAVVGPIGTKNPSA